jgi:hypothetical protein
MDFDSARIDDEPVMDPLPLAKLTPEKREPSFRMGFLAAHGGQYLINAVTVHMGTGTNLSGKPLPGTNDTEQRNPIA